MANQILTYFFIFCFISAAIHIISAFTFSQKLRYKSIEFHSDKASKSLKGIKIAFITDIHDFPLKKLAKAAKKIKELKADIVLLGGDFSEDYFHRKETLKILNQIKPSMGFFGVSGNHDNCAILEKEMKAYNMSLLKNSGKHISNGLYICGVEDFIKGNPDYNKAISASNDSDFIITLCHNPDVSMEIDMSSSDIVLCGHTHGGQISAFGFWAPALTFTKITKYGQKFKGGFTKAKNNANVFVSKGLGSHLNLRMMCPPEIIFLTLK